MAECGTGGRISLVGHHYLTHLSVSPDSSRIAFLHRYPLADGGECTRLMTIGTDGSNLRCLAQGFLSHFDWKDDHHIFIFGRANSPLESFRNNPVLANPIVVASLRLAKRTVKALIGRNRSIVSSSNSFMMVEDKDNTAATPFAKDIIPLDGHPMMNPVYKDWCVNDTYPDKEGFRDLMLYNFVKEKRIDIGRFRMISDKPEMSLLSEFFKHVDLTNVPSLEDLAFTRSGLHCDLHPRWNSKGDKAFFDSIHEGTRQLYFANVRGVISG